MHEKRNINIFRALLSVANIPIERGVGGGVGTQCARRNFFWVKIHSNTP